uniref:AB hydrolase-1 domain-containing protein n=1 Tax=Glossina brevipalpis TaxID=37001 RepID=A0A1A9W7K5_9MUSC
MATTDANCSEIRIQVPWGHIAGQWYGDQLQRPILALHGWLDNCGTFAKLAPLLTTYRSILCIDLPGHGFSSHLPIGIHYEDLEYVRAILRIMEAYNWKTVSLMGHSMGGSIAFHFAAFYPEYVDMIISLDFVKQISYTPEYMPTVLKYIITKNMELDERIMDKRIPTEPPCYTMEECEHLLHEATDQSVNLENCKHILERNITRSTLYPEKYYFSRDGRIKVKRGYNASPELIIEMAKRISRVSMPYLVIKGGSSTNPSSRSSAIEDYLKKSHKRFTVRTYAPGTHHLHLNNANEVSQIIIQFLQNYDSLRKEHFIVKAKM